LLRFHGTDDEFQSIKKLCRSQKRLQKSCETFPLELLRDHLRSCVNGEEDLPEFNLPDVLQLVFAIQQGLEEKSRAFWDSYHAMGGVIKKFKGALKTGSVSYFSNLRTNTSDDVSSVLYLQLEIVYLSLVHSLSNPAEYYQAHQTGSYEAHTSEMSRNIEAVISPDVFAFDAKVVKLAKEILGSVSIAEKRH